MDAQPGSAARQLPTPSAGADVPGFVRALVLAFGADARDPARWESAWRELPARRTQEQQLPELPVIAGLLAELPAG